MVGKSGVCGGIDRHMIFVLERELIYEPYST
jgi:hypothetical protein